MTSSTHSFDYTIPAGIEAYLKSDQSLLKRVDDEEVQVDGVARLSGGLANHTYRAVFKAVSKGDSEPTKSVVLKYSPPTVAFNPDFPLTTKRGFYEYSILSKVPSLKTSNPELVRAPTAIAYDDTANVLAISDAGPDSRNLKQLLVEGGEGLDTKLIGQGLGEWLAELHLWGATPAAASLREVLAQNTEMANVALTYTFNGLVPEDDPLWKEVRAYANSVIAQSDPATTSTSSPCIVHGDFWTGNILVAKEPQTGKVRLTVVDWEAANSRNITWNDIGQMCSELYQPTLFGMAGERGRELVAEFIKAYLSRRKLSDEEIRMAVVRFGVHLFVWPGVTGWGDEESVEKCKKLGREYIERGWKADWEWIKTSVLGDLIIDRSV